MRKAILAVILFRFGRLLGRLEADLGGNEQWMAPVRRLAGGSHHAGQRDSEGQVGIEGLTLINADRTRCPIKNSTSVGQV